MVKIGIQKSEPADISAGLLAVCLYKDKAVPDGLERGRGHRRLRRRLHRQTRGNRPALHKRRAPGPASAAGRSR